MSSTNFLIGILQPGYLPWLGFFEQMDRIDKFVILDDVQYTKADWRSRNRIRVDNEEGYVFLTAPVRRTAVNAKIRDMEIDYSHKWVKRHLNLLKHNYRDAEYFDEYFPRMEEVYSKRPKYLIDLDMALAHVIAQGFGITTHIVFSSSLDAPGQ